MTLCNANCQESIIYQARVALLDIILEYLLVLIKSSFQYFKMYKSLTNFCISFADKCGEFHDISIQGENNFSTSVKKD